MLIRGARASLQTHEGQFQHMTTYSTIHEGERLPTAVSPFYHFVFKYGSQSISANFHAGLSEWLTIC